MVGPICVKKNEFALFLRFSKKRNPNPNPKLAHFWKKLGILLNRANGPLKAWNTILVYGRAYLRRKKWVYLVFAIFEKRNPNPNPELGHFWKKLGIC